MDIKQRKDCYQEAEQSCSIVYICIGWDWVSQLDVLAWYIGLEDGWKEAVRSRPETTIWKFTVSRRVANLSAPIKAVRALLPARTYLRTGSVQCRWCHGLDGWLRLGLSIFPDWTMPPEIIAIMAGFQILWPLFAGAVTKSITCRNHANDLKAPSFWKRLGVLWDVMKVCLAYLPEACICWWVKVPSLVLKPISEPVPDILWQAPRHDECANCSSSCSPFILVRAAENLLQACIAKRNNANGLSSLLRNVSETSWHPWRHAGRSHKQWFWWILHRKMYGNSQWEDEQTLRNLHNQLRCIYIEYHQCLLLIFQVHWKTCWPRTYWRTIGLEFWQHGERLQFWQTL